MNDFLSRLKRFDFNKSEAILFVFLPVFLLLELILTLTLHLTGGISAGQFLLLQLAFIGPALLIGGAVAALAYFVLPRGIRVTCLRELESFFNSPIAYVCVIVFTVAASVLSFTLGSFIERQDASLTQSFFTFHPWIFMIVAPAIGMRLWSEEHRQGTIELLTTYPIAIWHAIIGKFLASCVVIFGALFCTWPAVVTLEILGDPDWGPMWTGYVGSFLLAISCLGITSVVSAFTRSQVVAFLISVLLCVLFLIIGFPPVADVAGIIPGLDTLFTNLGFWNHFQELNKGLITIWDLSFFLILTAVCLFVTAVILRARRAGTMTEGLMSSAGIAIVAVIGIVGYIAISFLPIRFDFTEHNIYTLSKGTKNIVRGLDTPVKIRYFVTDGRDYMSPQERQFARRVEDMLVEYQKLGSQIEFEKINPEPDTNEEDAARLAGLPEVPGQQGAMYFGIVVSCLDKQEPILFGNPMQEDMNGREQLLEYEISNAINHVYDAERPKITIMTSMQIGGGFSGNFQAPPARAWFLHQQLERDFDVTIVPTSERAIDKNTDVLIVLHPYDIAEAGEFAIDQYLLGGGTVVAMVDPQFFAARFMQPQQQQPNPFGGPPPGQGPAPSSNLPTLFEKWGVEYSASKVLADRTYQTRIQGGQQVPTVLSLSENAMNRDNVVTTQLNDLFLLMPGGFKVDPPAGIEVESLLISSDDTQLVNSFEAEPGEAMERLQDEFVKSGQQYELAVRLTGSSFETAFPDGDPSAPAPAPEPDDAPESSDQPDAADAPAPVPAPAPAPAPAAAGDDCQDAAADAPAEAEPNPEPEAEPEAPKSDPSLKKSVKQGSVVLIGDCDFIYDQFAVQMFNIGGMQMAQPANQNLSFLQNLTENLAGNSELISIRSRSSTRRPFTLLNKMEADARDAINARIADLEKEADDVTKKIQEYIQIEAEAGAQEVVLKEEQIAELEGLRKREYEARSLIREERKALRRDIDGKIFWIKALNIVPMALLVAIIGLLCFLVRVIRTAAR